MGAPKTFTEYLLDVDASSGGHRYAHILSAIAVSVKLISSMVSRGSLVQDSRDRLAVQTLVERLRGVEQLAAVSIANEPAIRPFAVGDSARYLLLVEALHGGADPSSNQTVGLTFSILERQSRCQPLTTQEFLQPGSSQLCAGLVLFGPATVMAISTGRGVDGFTFDRDVGNFVLTHPGVIVPSESSRYSIDAGEALHWVPPIKRYVDECVQGVDGPRRRAFSMRWNPSPVIGAFRIFGKGGLFLVPQLDRQGPSWGVSLLHTAAPIAMIAEQCGAAATTGTTRILELLPRKLTQRTPIVFGSKAEVSLIADYYDQHSRGLDTDSDYPLFHDRTLFVDAV